MSAIYEWSNRLKRSRVDRVRYKGKLIMWSAEKAFGFIQPIADGAHVFTHKSALSNNKRNY
jgi:hypothetical protein